MGARIGRAFLFGGCVAVVGHLCLTIAGMFVPDVSLATIVGMAVFGIVSAVIIASGLYDKLSKFADFGADQPLSGLMYGAAMNTVLARAEGAPAGKALLKGFVMVVMIVGIGFIVCAVMGALIG